jgi:hypothetical protein
MKKLAWIVLCTAIFCLSGVASADEKQTCTAKIKDANKPSENQQTPVQKIKNTLDLNNTPGCAVELLLLRRNDALLKKLAAGVVAAQNAATQTVQQNGASAGGGGTTNLVSKSVTSKVLSLASEYGALTETTSGTTTTVSGTLDGIPLALESNSIGLISECPVELFGQACISSRWLNIAGRISYSAALNTTQAPQLTGVATGPTQGNSQPVSVAQSGTTALSQLTGRVVLRQPHIDYATLISALKSLDSNSPLQKNALALKNAGEILENYQDNTGTVWDKWADNTAAMLAAISNDEDRLEKWKALGNELAEILIKGGGPATPPTDDQLTQAALTFAGALDAYGSAERSFYEGQLNAKPILSFEYDENRPASQPTNSVFRLIYGQPLSKNWTLTANAAVSIYDQNPSSSIPGAQRLRDIQLAIETDYTLKKLGILGTPIVSGAYYFQDQTSPAILNVTPGSPVPGITFVGLSANATQAFAAKGKISIGQLRISLGNSQSGFRVPLAITFSNRTELTTGFKVGAQIGISYNFDSLFGK